MSGRPRIEPERLRALLAGINDFGRDPVTGGFDRIGYSASDMAVRDWFADVLRADGLDVRRDPVGNLFGRWGPSDGPALLIGSHLDTVPQGGAFDGALGVAAALETVRALRAAGVTPACAVEVVATAEEEGRFGGMLGSQAIAGCVDHAWFEAARDAEGLQLREAMRSAGLDPDAVAQAARPAADLVGFLELHIEQGPVLESGDVPVGIATGVSGCCVLQITLTGAANHSGTTPMPLRADAFAGLAAVAAQIPELIAEVGTDQSRLTIGKVALQPDEVHTIPGSASFSLVLRDIDIAVMHALRAGVEARLRRGAARHRLDVTIAERSWLAPVALDAGLREIFRDAAKACGHRALEMPSGAGHDAQTLQAVCPAGLLFVPSRGGISHSPAEHTDFAACVAGAEVLLAAAHRICTGASTPHGRDGRSGGRTG